MNILAVLIVGLLFVGGLIDKPEEKKITQVTNNTVLDERRNKKVNYSSPKHLLS